MASDVSSIVKEFESFVKELRAVLSDTTKVPSNQAIDQKNPRQRTKQSTDLKDTSIVKAIEEVRDQLKEQSDPVKNSDVIEAIKDSRKPIWQTANHVKAIRDILDLGQLRDQSDPVPDQLKEQATLVKNNDDVIEAIKDSRKPIWQTANHVKAIRDILELQYVKKPRRVTDGTERKNQKSAIQTTIDRTTTTKKDPQKEAKDMFGWLKTVGGLLGGLPVLLGLAYGLKELALKDLDPNRSILDQLLESAHGMLTLIAKQIGKTFASFLDRIGKTLTTLPGAVGKIFKGIGENITKFIDDIPAKIGGVLKAMGGRLVDVVKKIPKGGASVGKVLSNIGKSNLFKSIGATLSKVLGRALKVLPGIGLAISLYSAHKRIQRSDWLGALMDVGSGIASLFPGIGTGISIGLDVLNAIRDIKGGSRPEVKPKGEGQGFFTKVGSFVSGVISKALPYIPGVGMLINLSEAWKRFTGGDMIGGLLDFGQAIAVNVPGIGTAFAAGLGILQGMLDSEKQEDALSDIKSIDIFAMMGKWVKDKLLGFWEHLKNLWPWGKKNKKDKGVKEAAENVEKEQASRAALAAEEENQKAIKNITTDINTSIQGFSGQLIKATNNISSVLQSESSRAELRHREDIEIQKQMLQLHRELLSSISVMDNKPGPTIVSNNNIHNTSFKGSQSSGISSFREHAIKYRV